MTAGACADNLANQSYSKAFHVAYQLGQPVPAFYRSVIQISFHFVDKGIKYLEIEKHLECDHQSQKKTIKYLYTKNLTPS